MQFTVATTRDEQVDGRWSADGIMFDVGRRRELSYTAMLGTPAIETSIDPEYFPAYAEVANDDSRDNDESSEPNENGHIFDYDAPGFDGINDVLPFPVIRSFLNLENYVRVSFDGQDPTGNRLAGSRASDVVLFHARNTVQWVGAGINRTDGQGNLTQAEDINNDVGVIIHGIA